MSPSTLGPQMLRADKLASTQSVGKHSHSDTYVMGNLFFLSPPAPTSTLRPTGHGPDSLVTPSSRSACLSGALFLFLTPHLVPSKEARAVHSSLSRWIASHGGRVDFCRWIQQPSFPALCRRARSLTLSERAHRCPPLPPRPRHLISRLKRWSSVGGIGVRLFEEKMSAALASNPDREHDTLSSSQLGSTLA